MAYRRHQSGLFFADYIDGGITIYSAPGRTVGVSSLGGHCQRMENRSDHASVRGELVTSDASVDAAYDTEEDQYDTIGIVMETGKAIGEQVWLCTIGPVYVLLENSTLSGNGFWVYQSTVDGRANASLTQAPGGGVPEHDEHFKELGHCLQAIAADADQGSGAGIDRLCLVHVHFN